MPGTDTRPWEQQERRHENMRYYKTKTFTYTFATCGEGLGWIWNFRTRQNFQIIKMHGEGKNFMGVIKNKTQVKGLNTTFAASQSCFTVKTLR
jgi:hypothetical protein